MSSKKTALLILDGWGKGEVPSADAILQADTPFVDGLLKKYPNSELVTFGEEVGLPQGQMGNSEVGHLNIGAGRIVYQELARINKAIRENALGDNPVIQDMINHAKVSKKNVHLLGLLSDGGVHSHINHIKAICKLLDEENVKNVFVHAFMDGRDTDPKSGINFIKNLEESIAHSSAKLATVTGRYYAMDRDKRWERVKIAYDALVKGVGEMTSDFVATIRSRYDQGETDEFLKPIIAEKKSEQPLTIIQPDDIIFFTNFRTDRPRQLTEVLSQVEHQSEGMKTLPLYFVTMTNYDIRFRNIHVVFEKSNLENTLGEIISKADKTQVRIAETEKYPHVTFFFSGGREKPFEGESRILINSPKVPTYDHQPEMSAYEVTDAIIQKIDLDQPDFICLNYANADMVGHTGVFNAAMMAAEAVDKCLHRLIPKLLEYDYDVIIIADHGNSDYMVNEDGSPNTAHTKNPVPCIYVSKNLKSEQIESGKLADIAPTLLKIMDLDQPSEMDGNSLI